MSITPRRGKGVGFDGLSDAVDSIRPHILGNTRTPRGVMPRRYLSRIGARSGSTYRKPLDIELYYESPSESNDRYRLKLYDDTTAGIVAWIAGAKFTLSGSGFTWDNTEKYWEIDAAITNDSCCYIEMDRAGVVATLKQATSFPNGTDSKEVFPVWFIPFDSGSDSIIAAEIVDLRGGTVRWVAGA